MDSNCLIWIWAGTFPFVLGMALSMVFTAIRNRLTKVLIPVSLPTRMRLVNRLNH
jgi:hypothetical protein